MSNAPALCLLAVLLTSTATLAAPAKLSPGPLTFTLTETSGVAGERLATVSLPFAAGEMKPPDYASVQPAKGPGAIAQCRVLNRWPDGSARRALLRFPWNPAARASSAFTVTQGPIGFLHRDLVIPGDRNSLSITAGPRTIRTDDTGLIISRGGKDECRVSFAGASFPAQFRGPQVSVIENGAYFAWARIAYADGSWNVELEVQADFRGEVRLTGRLRMMQGAAQPVPHFGLTLTGLSGDLVTDKPQTLPFAATTADAGPRLFHFGADTAITLPDGPQIRQGRVTVDAAQTGSVFTLTRDAARDNTLEDKHKQFYEGQERSVELVLPPPGETHRTCRADIPALRRCVAVEGEAPVSWGKLQRLCDLNTERALQLACHDGDQYGDLTAGVNRAAPKWTLTGLTRIDTCLDMLEDYYRGGDWRLRDLALGWAENWVTLKQYRGSDADSYGGERYTSYAWQLIPSFGQKGIMMIARAYEETGDPRYLESALAFADRVVKQMQTREFFTSTTVAPTGIGGDANIRPAYLGRDLVLMYRWIGKAEYLDAARKILHGLASLSSNASSYGLLREGYSDPHSPFERLITGTDLGVTDDNSDHLKPFILNYVLEGAQYVFEETHDPIARDMVRNVSDFQLDAMGPGGFWNYAQRHAAEGNSIQHMSLEIANTLLKSYTLTGDRRYQDAALNTIHFICKAFDTYGALPDGVVPPSDRAYFYPDDHCDLDFYRGSVNLTNINRDPTGYFFSAVDRALRLGPKAEAFLLSPPTDPRHKWLIEQVPINAGAANHEIGNCFIATLDFGRDGDQESKGKSDLVLLEDGKPLGPAHCLHRDIRELGRGRYSHWTHTGLYMSSSDNTDPTVNGRKYEFYFGDPDKIPSPEGRKLITTGGPFAGRKPHPSVELYAKGLAAENDKRWTYAITIWEQVLAKWPDSAPELHRQIALWEKAGNEAQMLATCKRFVTTFPKHSRTPSVKLRLAQHALASGQKGDARQWLEQVAQEQRGTAWGEEAEVRLWHELGVAEATATVIHAVRGTEPKPQALRVLQASDGQASPLSPQIGAAYDATNLYLRLSLPLAWPWPAPGSIERMRLIFDARGEMTDYSLFICDSSGGLAERPAMWHNRGEGIRAAEGWQAKVTRGDAGWQAEITIPFAKLGFRPEPGRRTWRFGFRWESLSGTLFWRPSLPTYTRPQDCGWIAFD